MSKRAAKKDGKQASKEKGPWIAMQQLMLPMMLASDAIKQGLLAFVQQMGMLALRELLGQEAESLAGPKGKHAPEREYNHWGSAPTPLPFGGRQVVIQRPRVRGKGKGGREVELPTIEALRESDPMPERVAEQVALGVSTRGYDRSLEPVDAELESRGTSKSNASRALIERTSEKVLEFLNRNLEELSIVAMYIDGIVIAKHSIIIALGVTTDGTKVPLGIWSGSTENAVVATALIQNLLDRGLRVDTPLLFVIDGGKGIRKSLKDVFGDRAIVQRCQIHKIRNVCEHLPEERRDYVARQMRDAYKSKSAGTAKKKLQQLIAWLEANGEQGAAASLREGLEETLTVLRLGLPELLSRSFATTNAIENMNGTLRRVLRNVKRWRGEGMILRWVALGIGEATRGFRRVKGYKKMDVLVAALRPRESGVVEERKVA